MQFSLGASLLFHFGILTIVLSVVGQKSRSALAFTPVEIIAISKGSSPPKSTLKKRSPPAITEPDIAKLLARRSLASSSAETRGPDSRESEPDSRESGPHSEPAWGSLLTIKPIDYPQRCLDLKIEGTLKIRAEFFDGKMRHFSIVNQVEQCPEFTERAMESITNAVILNVDYFRGRKVNVTVPFHFQIRDL